MFENAIYSVISPEGCATILWRDPKKMLDAAKAMKLSAKDLLDLKVIDEIIEEPLGGAHRDKKLVLDNVKKSILSNLETFKDISPEDVLNQRKNRFLKIGRHKGFVSNPENLSELENKKSNIFQFLQTKKNKLLLITGSFLFLSALLFFIL
jgi:acetyl-CoA carboxylase carboxyl transferase subunit alpha